MRQTTRGRHTQRPSGRRGAGQYGVVQAGVVAVVLDVGEPNVHEPAADGKLDRERCIPLEVSPSDPLGDPHELGRNRDEASDRHAIMDRDELLEVEHDVRLRIFLDSLVQMRRKGVLELEVKLHV